MVQRAYAAVAEWCAHTLWSPIGEQALHYLRGRGLDDNTIRTARLGYHPAGPGGVGPELWANDRDAYEGARLGGMLGPQGVPKSVLRRAVTLPYFAADGTCTLIRSRALDPNARIRYLSPAGVPLYAGGIPTLYGMEALGDAGMVLLSEGEFKALLARQHQIPALGQPGIGYLPDAFVQALAGRIVILCYDAENRTNPFDLSPGERYTINAAARLTGRSFSERIQQIQSDLIELEKRAKTMGDAAAKELLLRQFEEQQLLLKSLHEQQRQLRDLRIQIRVLRLPRAADQAKIDLDSFLLAHGPQRLRALIDQAPDAELWLAAHSGGGYRYERGGIWNGSAIANYQARIVETVYQSDGLELRALQRVALRTPSGRLLSADIPDDEWADDRAARLALRRALLEGTFDDDSREILRAVRLLSNQGDPPRERHVFTATGWELLRGRWHFLSSDGALTASGIEPTIRAEIDPEATGNHYALCGPGDAQAGAAAWRAFLFGEVCPQPLALILAAQAALPLIHPWMGDAARSMVWLYNQTGSLKTALTRAAVMALYGPRFTAERADGAPVPKWASTTTGLSFLTFYYRHMPVLIDDYKRAMIGDAPFAQFVQSYSEGSSRTRGTKGLKIERSKSPRCIVFSTAEDQPQGDPGVQARLISLALAPNAVSEAGLAQLQRAGAAGHLAAFWRQFIQSLALELDTHGERALRERIQVQIQADDGRLAGHRRTAGSLRQNRAAWLVLSAWLQQAGYISADEVRQLDEAHLQARSLLAQVLDDRQRESRASTVFLNVLSELIAGGALVIEEPGLLCPRCGSEMARSSAGWFCNGVVTERELACNYHLPAQRIIGFRCADGIAIQAERAFQEVSRVRNDQRQPFQYSSPAVWQQLEADGTLAARGRDRFTVVRRNPAVSLPDGTKAPATVLLLRPEALAQEPHDLHDKTMRSMRSCDQEQPAPRPDAESSQVDTTTSMRSMRSSNTAMRSSTQNQDRIDRTGSHACDPTCEAPECSQPDLRSQDRMFLEERNVSVAAARPVARPQFVRVNGTPLPNTPSSAAGPGYVGPSGDVNNPEVQDLIARLNELRGGQQ